MKKAQVLIFIDWYAPGYKAGGPVRSMVNMVSHLHKEIDFHIVTSDTEYTERKPYSDIRSDEWTSGEFGEQIYYASDKARSKAVWEALLAHKAWDTIYVNGIYSTWYSAAPLWFSRKTNVKKIVASRGMLAPGPMKHGSFKKRLFLFVMKRFGAYKGVLWQATNEDEAGHIRQRISGSEVTVVPNLPKKLNHTSSPARTKVKGELKIVSVARIAVEKNTHLAIESLQGLVGKVSFDLYGPVYDDGYWQACQDVINQLSNGVLVLSHGPVHPSGVSKILQEAHVLLMPSSGENFGHTMLEALSAGLPMLISDKTPWRQLAEVKAGWDLPVEPEDEAQLVFEKKLQDFVNMDQTEYDIWSAGAFEFAKTYLSDPEPLELNRTLFQ